MKKEKKNRHLINIVIFFLLSFYLFHFHEIIFYFFLINHMVERKQKGQTSFTRWCYYKTLWLDYFIYIYIVALWDGNGDLLWATSILHISYYYFIILKNLKHEVNPKEYSIALSTYIKVVFFIIITIHQILFVFLFYFLLYLCF